ncbi:MULTISPECIES: hypothetical protein [Acinetobacter]|uniref:hypothetical protein n=1 Tax=Acinetobacter TaxID=469 RepID=UPI000806C403|nr:MULTISPECIES: hypothetical protein [Acinetobacter]OBY75134.1 hypothetical protein NG55_00165 [Acinetobacter gyllenbergii]
MSSEQFIQGIQYELQNRAFALKAITRISIRMQGTAEYVFWDAYRKLEQFNTPRYAAYAHKLGLDATPSFLTEAKAWTMSSIPALFLNQLLQLVHTRTIVYMENLKKVRTLGSVEDRAFLNYMIAQEQLQIEFMELAIKKQYQEIKPRLDQFIDIYTNIKLI